MTVLAASPAFSSDDGSADPRVSAALAAYGGGTGGSGDVLLALAATRLLVPVVAVLDEPADDGAGEKSSHMAAVSTIGRSGRRGLLAFTCLDTMRAWDPQARPVPVTTRAAAEAALADKADAMVVDLAGPVTFAVEAEDLRSLASGWRSHAVDAGITSSSSSSPRADRTPPPASSSGVHRVARVLRRLSRRPGR